MYAPLDGWKAAIRKKEERYKASCYDSNKMDQLLVIVYSIQTSRCNFHLLPFQTKSVNLPREQYLFFQIEPSIYCQSNDNDF